MLESVPQTSLGYLEATVDQLLQSVEIGHGCQIVAHRQSAEKNVTDHLRLNVRICEVNRRTLENGYDLLNLLQSLDKSTVVCLRYETVNETVPKNDMEDRTVDEDEPRVATLQFSRETVLEAVPQPLEPHANELRSLSLSGHAVGVANSFSNSCSKNNSDIVSCATGDFNPELSENELRGDGAEGFLFGKESPVLLEFDTVGTHVSTGDSSQPKAEHMSPRANELPMSQRLKKALDTVALGGCVICVSQDVNPIAEIELLALSIRVPIISINLGSKLRLRPTPEAFLQAFKAVMKDGAWFVLTNAHKSIATCSLLEDLLQDCEKHNFSGFNPQARIIICMEPHPHFPIALLRRAEVAKVRSSSSSSLLSLSLVNSMTRDRLVRAGSCSLRHPCLYESKNTSVDGADAQRRRVRINREVEVVDIAPRAAVVTSKNESSFLKSGCLSLHTAFSGLMNDRFLCVVNAGEGGRFAVGSMLGCVYLVDDLGNSLLQAQTHEASVWDISFRDKFHFASGCEDGNCVEWDFELNGDEGAALVPFSVTAFGSDLYCLTYLRGRTVSPLLVGGLKHELMIRATDGKLHFIQVSSNAQVMDSFPSTSVALVGGSDGGVTFVDVTTAVTLAVLAKHKRKVPALTIRDDNHFFTGSFDNTILSWDHRAPSTPMYTIDTSTLVELFPVQSLKLKGYVTGLHVDDVHLAANVGETLFLWDTRKMSTVLGSFSEAWKGLTRGVQVHSAGRCIVTASQDGYVRFWNYL